MGPRALIACLAVLPGVARGHSGDDFIALDSFGVGHVWESSVDAFYDWEAYDGIDELSAEVSLFTSPLPRVGIGVGVRFAEDANGDWVYSSASPSLHIQLTDPHGSSPIRVAISIGYQFAEDISVQDTITTIEEITTYEEETVIVPAAAVAPVPDGGGTGGTGGEPPCNPLLDLDCEPAPKSGEKGAGVRLKHGGHTETRTKTKTSTTTRTELRAVTETVETTTTVRRGGGGHTGIHNHDVRQWMGRLVLETDLGRTRVTGNLIATVPENDHAYWGYGIGARRPVFGNLAIGVEAIGDFLPGGEHEIITSLHYDLGSRASVRVGTGFGLGSDSPDFTLRTGLLLRF